MFLWAYLIIVEISEQVFKVNKDNKFIIVSKIFCDVSQESIGTIVFPNKN